MTQQTRAKLEAAIDRMLEEFGVDDYETLIASFEDVILFALFKQVGLAGVLPQASSVEAFSDARQHIATRARVSKLLGDLGEPSPEELTFALQRFKELPSVFKRLLKEMDTQIKPRGGPPEKFSDPIAIRRITDELFDRQKQGEKVSHIKADIAKRIDISLSTLDRRVSEEIKRRSQLIDSLRDEKDRTIEK